VVTDTALPPVVAVMSRQAQLIVQLRQAGVDVVEAKDLDRLADVTREAAVAVLDLTSSEGRRGAVARISTTVDPAVPLVLISPDEVDLAILGSGREVHVVVPPLHTEDVIACVERILLHRESSTVHAVRTPRAEHLAQGPPVGTVERNLEVLAAASKPTRTVSPAPGPPVPPPRLRPWPALAAEFLDRVAGVGSVGDTAQALAADAAQACSADVAVLVRASETAWVVEGGIGLRGFEWGQRLDDDHWLVRAARDRGPTLSVSDTDGCRAELVGAPLASRRRLLRTIAKSGRFLVCAGWDGDPRPAAVTLLAAAVSRHENALEDAILLRRVAVDLGRLVGPDAPLP
jgi:hypothetical protein